MEKSRDRVNIIELDLWTNYYSNTIRKSCLNIFGDAPSPSRI